MRAVGVAINHVPKMQGEDPIAYDNSLSFEHSGMRIPLQENGVLSCFHTRVPTKR